MKPLSAINPVVPNQLPPGCVLVAQHTTRGCPMPRQGISCHMGQPPAQQGRWELNANCHCSTSFVGFMRAASNLPGRSRSIWNSVVLFRHLSLGSGSWLLSSPPSGGEQGAFGSSHLLLRQLAFNGDFPARDQRLLTEHAELGFSKRLDESSYFSISLHKAIAYIISLCSLEPRLHFFTARETDLEAKTVSKLWKEWKKSQLKHPSLRRN